MKIIKIGKKYIGENRPVFVIAEIGSNHNQDIRLGKRLIDAAAKAKVDAVKFQSFTVGNWVSKEFTAFPTLDKKQNVYAQLKKCELPYDMFVQLKRYAENKGLVCFSSPSHISDVDELGKIGVPAFKFGSVQITDLPTIVHAAKKRRPILLSVGASTLEEIQEAVHAVHATGNQNLVLFHCTTLYPARIDQVNLRMIGSLQKEFDVLVGYSDHTTHPTIVPVAAVAAGVCAIEKHFTLDRGLKGPDHSFALEPKELAEMVSAIRDTEKALGSSEKKCLPEERELARLGRRSIVALTDIYKGSVISKKMVTTKRPGYGIQPKHLHKVIGMQAKVNIPRDTVLKWKKLKQA